jgi:oligosaccharide 4-alpha-D-glucosyltransferase
MSKLKSQLQVSNSSNTISVKTDAGEWRLQQFKSNVIKVVYQPLHYENNDYLSDAVIAKPLPLKIPRQHVHDVSLGIFRYTIEDGLQINGPADMHIFPASNHEGYHGFRFSIVHEERFYGGGSRAIPQDRRGHRLALYNAPNYAYAENAANLNYSVPFIISSRGYALFFDNPSKAYLDIGATQHDILEYGAVSGELNFYLIAGSPQTILKTYHDLTGTQPLPPRWALGNLMSRFGYTSQKQVKEIARKMHQEEIPFDAVIFDLFWFGDGIKGTMGNLDWVNKATWPDPKGMIQSFKKGNIQSILITEPFFLKSANNYKLSEKFHAVDANGEPYVMTDFYFGDGGLIDIFREDARKWFWTKYKKQMNLGVEAWWGDLGEPERHPSNMFHDLKYYGLKRLFRADEIHNLYGHTWTKFLYENYARDYPNKRLFSLNRSGFAGTQRYSIFPWSGDVNRSWEGYRAQLPVMLGAAISGVPYMHADAGGFAFGTGDNELYIRWLQFAAFTPIFRPHGTAVYDIDPGTFSFPSEPALFDEPYRSIAKQIVHNRYQLLPYNYTLAYRQSAFGEPLVKPLHYAFPNDAGSIGKEHEYLWGNSILVAPVMYPNVADRDVYLPPGDWYKMGDVQKIMGGGYVKENVLLETMPLYVKAGSVIPFAERKKIRTTNDCLNDDISWHYYPSNSTTIYELYDDDGTTKDAFRKNLYDMIHISIDPSGDTYKIRIAAKNGTYRGKPKIRKMQLIIHQPDLNNIEIIETNTPLRRTQHTSKENELVSVHFNFIGTPVRFIIKK